MLVFVFQGGGEAPNIGKENPPSHHTWKLGVMGVGDGFVVFVVFVFEDDVQYSEFPLPFLLTTIVVYDDCCGPSYFLTSSPLLFYCLKTWIASPILYWIQCG